MDTISLVFILGYTFSICISADTNNIEASCNVSSLGSKTALVCSQKVKHDESARAENLPCSNSTIKNVTNIYIGIKDKGGCTNSPQRSSGHDVKCCQLDNKTDILLNAKCLQNLHNNTDKKYDSLMESARNCKGLETCKIQDTILHVPARYNLTKREYSNYIILEYSCSSELENKENNSNANENLSTRTNNQLTTTVTTTTESIPQTDVEPSTSRSEDTKTSLGTENEDISLDKRKQNKGDFQTRTVVIAATVGIVVLGILMTVLACLRIRRKEATKVTSEKDTSKTSDNLTRRNLDNIEQGVEETPLKSDEDHIYDQADETTGRITASTTGGQTKDHQMEQNEDTYDHTDLSRRKSAPIRTERAQSEETNPYDLTESAAAVAKIRMSVTDNTYDHTGTDEDHIYDQADETTGRITASRTGGQTKNDQMEQNEDTYDHTDLSRRKSAPIRTQLAQSEETNPYDLTESAAAVAKIRMSVTDNTYDHTGTDEDHIYDQADETIGRITVSRTGEQTEDHQMEQNEDTYDHTDLSRRKSAPIRTERAQSEETNPYDLTESAAAVAKIRMSVTDNTYDHTRTDNTYDHTGTDNTYDRTGTDNTYDRTGTDNTYDRTGTDNTYDHTGTDSTYDRT